MRVVSMLGLTFGRLTVFKRVENSKHNRAQWLCRCDCGTRKIADGAELRNGHVQSCGCQKRDTAQKMGQRNARHGLTNTPTWQSWKAMLERVQPTHKSRKYYYDRNITVIKRWLIFENFLTDMGERPTGTTLDRIDNNRGYTPGNCRWVTPKQQAANRRPPCARSVSSPQE